MKDLISRFERPGPEYRGKPFWAWNGSLEESELRRQIRVIRRMGLGGFFMHSRVGLATPYLSEEWFQLVRACVDEARRYKMEAWLYDEDRWPSGAAGGLATKDSRYRMRRLRMSILKPGRFVWNEQILCAFTANVKGRTAQNVEPLPHGSGPRSAPAVLSFQRVIAESSPWYNGFTYLDTLSESAVRKFIETTHEKYLANMAQEFGQTVPGIFTDEPNYGYHEEVREPGEGVIAAWDFPWTDSLPRVFEERYGYSLLEYLPELFLDVERIDVSRARYHYHDCLTSMFVNAFAKTIGDWCGSHHLLSTGHVLCEESLSSQTFVVGSAMRFYEHMQAPGIDNLTENNYEFDTAKQCSSVVHQMGCKWMLSELYGCTGWDFPFEGHKADGNWQAALGVNLRCPHLSWYTMLGQAKRDYPASISFQSSWWRYYSKVEDYFARINAVLTQGSPVRTVLVIHPIESTWVRFRADWPEQKEIRKLDQQLKTLRDWLLQSHLDFDYGDEEMMSRRAGVTAGPSGAQIAVGRALYHAVVVPPLLTIRATTVRLLRQFHEKGGLVVFAGDPPGYVDAVKDDEARKISKNCVVVPFSEKEIVTALEERSRVISISDSRGKEIPSLLYQLREDENAWYLFVVNNDRRNGYEAVIKMDARGTAEEWDPETGARYLAEQKKPDGLLTIATSFAATGSRLFVVKKKGRSGLPRRVEQKVVSRETLGRKRWEIQLDEPNAIVLDRPKYRIGSGKTRGPAEILRVDQEIRKSLDLPVRGGAMVQPWARKSKRANGSIPVRLSYTFTVRSVPRKAVDLVIERPDRFTISFNGFPVEPETDTGWWVDPCLRRLPLDPSWFRSDENTIVLKTTYTEDDGLEALFLLSDFGVTVKGTSVTMTEPVCDLTLGDWGKQGLPFYSSAVTYMAEFPFRVGKNKRVFLVLPRWKGCCVRVLVNGREAGIIAWEPHELDMTAFAKSGKNDLRIQVVSSRRNAFGPLHQADPENRWTGPEEFATKGKRWVDSYNLKPHGLLAAPVIEIRAPKRSGQ